jgi:hypothetical protein
MIMEQVLALTVATLGDLADLHTIRVAITPTAPMEIAYNAATPPTDHVSLDLLLTTD